jgi:predicted signal transduction protein with EAL and GGDEF domain
MATNQDVPPSDSSWLRVAAAWMLVGLPLLWGVFNTIKKALALFR